MSLRNRLPWLVPALLVFAACQIPGAAVALDDFHVATDRDVTEVDVLANDYVTGSEPTIEVLSGPSCGDLSSSRSSVEVAGMQQCEGVITLSYRVVDEFGSSGEANVEILLPGTDVTTTTTEVGLADLVPDRRLVDFGEVESETTGRQGVTFKNVGRTPAEVFDLVITPDTEFDVEDNDCERVIEPGASCFVDLTFTPSRDLPGDPALRSTPEEHRGVLQLVDDQRTTLAQVDLTGESIFLLADLTIDVTGFGLPGRAEGGVEVPMTMDIGNVGRADTSQFVITAEYQDVETQEWLPGFIALQSPAARLRVEPALAALPIPGLPVGSQEELAVRIELPGDFDPASALPVRVIIDSCDGDAAGPDCLVVEYDESNNISAALDVNPVFGTSEVELDGGLGTVGSGESNLANLVTDALFWMTTVRSEEFGLDGPRVSLLSSQTMLTGIIPPGDLRQLHLIDVWDSEIVVTDPVDTFVIKNALEQGVAEAGGVSREFRFPRLGNGSYDWCSGGADDGNRVFNIEANDTPLLEGGQVVDEETYPIATLDALVGRGPYQLDGLGYTGLGVTLRQTVIDYVQQLGTINSEVNEGAYQPGGNGRIVGFFCGVG